MPDSGARWTPASASLPQLKKYLCRVANGQTDGNGTQKKSPRWTGSSTGWWQSIEMRESSIIAMESRGREQDRTWEEVGEESRTGGSWSSFAILPFFPSLVRSNLRRSAEHRGLRGDGTPSRKDGFESVGTHVSGASLQEVQGPRRAWRGSEPPAGPAQCPAAN